MKLTGELKNQVEKAGMALSDEELEQVGVGSFVPGDQDESGDWHNNSCQRTGRQGG